MSHRARILLLPFAAALELCLLAVGWILAMTIPLAAKRLSDCAGRHLPPLEWYIDKDDG